MNDQLICKKCGAQLSSKDKTCPFCGSVNPNYIGTDSSPFSSATIIDEQKSKKTSSFKANYSWVIFWLLVIFFWPAAVIYIIWGLKK